MTRSAFERLLRERILVLDGGLGTMIQRYKLTEQDYRGERFADFPGQLKGNNDLLNITRPEVLKEIHTQYMEAGADIITTNTFNANVISMADYGTQAYVGEINRAGARLVREAAEAYTARTGRSIWVAGSIGPTNKTASMSPDVSDPAYRAVTYADLYAAYKEQIEALVEGGVDIILFETTFDTLNVKAGLEAAEVVLRERQADLPIMLSLTLSAQGGRTFSGQTLAAFLASVQHTSIVSVGLNCSFGAADMKPYLAELARLAPCFISAYPNAGLPNTFGEYDETPETMLEHVRPFVEEGLVNVLGGCCGTTPAHIAKFPELVSGKRPHQPAPKPGCLWLSGLELLEVKPENNFVNVGERCNVAGSRKFLRLIKEGNYEEALTIARKQVEDGAQVLDINMDDGMLDAVKEMTHFLNMIASEPDIARVPIMIDSSKWEVIEQGLMCVQGKSIVNSISLKEGEELFLRHAARIKQLGAATVVMAFDEQGQADTFERKIAICKRAYDLLTQKVGFNPQDIIFDPNILAIATGMEEHNGYGLAFIQAVEWIKQNLPGAKVSGGVSNLSFSFRGNDYVRNVMHSLFILDAQKAGMKMAIVNPSGIIPEDSIPEDLKKAVNDVLENTDKGATFRLVDIAPKFMAAKKAATQKIAVATTPDSHLANALISGNTAGIEDDIRALLAAGQSAISIIENVLIGAMNIVGERFGKGEMFLPQVVKSASVMKAAVEILTPEIEKGKQNRTDSAYKMVLATVKGDVHDIGKNIVAVVLRCNGFEIIDLGVMTPADKIIETAIETRADAIGLSGLITPSLAEMVAVARLMEKRGLKIPLFIGGATTSEMHTALKIAPEYSFAVVHTYDAAQLAAEAKKYINKATAAEAAKCIAEHHQALRNERNAKDSEHTEQLSLADARKRKTKLKFEPY